MTDQNRFNRKTIRFRSSVLLCIEQKAYKSLVIHLLSQNKSFELVLPKRSLQTNSSKKKERGKKTVAMPSKQSTFFFVASAYKKESIRRKIQTHF